jgi:septum site-determining protein MinC
MQQSSAKRRRRSAGPQASPRRSANLSALCKSELVALVSELQAQGRPAPEVVAGDISGARAPEQPAVADVSPPAAKPLRGPCLFIDDSVRSGQTVEFPDGDVTVIGSVGSGAEIIAGGSIHVYGTLRGRALAGTAGDGTARIFCRRFEAELLAIDGRYRVAENLDPSLRGRPVQARLDGMAMTLSPLD